MFSFGQALIDEVTKEVTERVTKEVTEMVTKEVTARKKKELDATLERDLLQFRESVAREMLADGYSIDQVARITLLSVGAVQSLSAQAARAAAEGSPLQEQPK